MDNTNAVDAYISLAQFGVETLIVGLLIFLLAISTMGVYTLNKIYHKLEDRIESEK